MFGRNILKCKEIVSIFTCIAGPGILPLIVKIFFPIVIFAHVELSFIFLKLSQKLLIKKNINNLKNTVKNFCRLHFNY